MVATAGALAAEAVVGGDRISHTVLYTKFNFLKTNVITWDF